MSKEEFEDLDYKIEIILSEEHRVFMANGHQTNGLGSFPISVTTVWRKSGVVPQVINKESNNTTLHSENADALIKLYNQASQSDKKHIVAYLQSLLVDGLETAYFVLFVLYRLGYLVEAYEGVEKDDEMAIGLHKLRRMLSEILKNEHGYLAKEQLRQLKDIIKDRANSHFELRDIYEQLNAAEFSVLENELSDINPEVNRDLEQVVTKWYELYGNDALPKIIDVIEADFKAGDMTDARFATCTERVRMLLKELAWQLITDSPNKDSPKAPKKDGDDKALLQYLVSIKAISLKECAVLKALYDLASTTGAHKSTANREHARITKNMAYEMVYMLLNRQTKKS